jgi:hypothetical protein
LQMRWFVVKKLLEHQTEQELTGCSADMLQLLMRRNTLPCCCQWHVSGALHAGSQAKTSLSFSAHFLQVHSKLAAVAAAGEQPLPLPARRGFRLPWQPQQQQQQQQEELQLWRLLDLSEVRALYKDAQRHGTLFKQHAKVQQRLAEQELAAAAAAAGTSSVKSIPEQQQQQQGVVDRRVVPTRLDDFLVVAELLRGLGDTPKDLLEDSFALITRTGRWADKPNLIRQGAAAAAAARAAAAAAAAALNGASQLTG